MAGTWREHWEDMQQTLVGEDLNPAKESASLYVGRILYQVRHQVPQMSFNCLSIIVFQSNR